MARPKKESSDYFDKLEGDIKSNQSTLSLVLGALIVLVVGVLIFNYFNRNKTPEVTPEAQTTEEEGDISPKNLPGKYTVKEGDTLFTIAEIYYKDGFKYSEIATENELANVNNLEVGQILEIPKLEATEMATEEATDTAMEEPKVTPEAVMEKADEATSEKGEETPAIGGADTTIWGPAIKGDTYTVAAGDWLSKIAGRAYGDIMAYQKIADANNITNPDLIEVGQVLKIPR